MKLLPFLAFLCWLPNLFGQNFQWAITGGSSLSDKATTVKVDADGYTYMTGYYNEQATFGSISIPFSDPHSKEVFIAKIDPSGNYVWVRHGENYYDDRGLGMCLDENGNVYVTGTCWGGITFDGNYQSLPSSYTDNIFIVKYDANGNFQWLKVCGTDVGDDHGHDIASDWNGNLYVTGFISSYCFGENGPSTAVFDGLNTASPNDSLAFLVKMTTAGNFTWVRTFDGEDIQKDNRVAVDPLGNPYVCGGFHGTVNFGTQTRSSNGGRDIFITKYSDAGNHLFVQTAGSSLDDRADGMVIGKDNHVYITGEFRDKVGFGLDSINNNGGPGGRDIFVARMDLNGNWKWAKKAGSNGGSDRGTAITINNKFNIFLTGQFKGNAKFGGDITLNSGTDSVQIFVAAIDTLGKWRWALQAGGAFEDRGCGIAVDSACRLVSCGYYVSNATFGEINLPGGIKKEIYAFEISDPCFDYDTPPEPPIVPEVETCITENYNIITPNGDGVNDTLQFSSDCNFTSTKCVIYNRWGNIVYSSNNLTSGWTGKDLAGANVAEGVYFYTIEATSSTGESFTKNGFVQLNK